MTIFIADNVFMPVDLPEVSMRRIGEKTQEIMLYCSQRRDQMTERAFELARLSFERLVQNIIDRNPKYSATPRKILEDIDSQNYRVACISEKQASVLAKGIVYGYIGDDLNLYPVSAKQKISRAKVRGLRECNIPIDEMTTFDIIYVVSAITSGENLSKSTMRAVFDWFKDIGLDPYEARIFATLFISGKPLSIQSLPLQSVLGSDYRKAIKDLVKKGFIVEYPGSLFSVTESVFE